MKTLFVALILFATCFGTAAAEATISFTKEIAPIFVAKCLACHNAEKARGAYRMHHFEALLKPGSSEDAPLVAGKPRESLLFQLITTTNEDDRMPQKDEALSAEQVAKIKRWIEEGVKFDGADRSLALAVLSPPQHPAAPRAYPRPLPVTALAFDPGGASLAAGGYHEITIWNSESGELVRRVGNVAERTFDLAFSPDGRWLASASGTPGRLGEVKLFDARSGELSRLLVTTADAALCLAFSADGKFLAAGGADNLIRVWDIGQGRQIHSIEQHADWVLAVAFSPDGELLASGSRDKSARIFEVRTGELETTHTGHGDFVTAVAWADNKSVISVSRERKAQRWNARDDKKIGDLTGWDAAPTRLLVFSNRLFSAAMDRRVREHNLEKKEMVRSFEGAEDVVHAIAWHAPSRRLAAGAHDGTVHVWNTDDGRPLVNFIAAPGQPAKLSRAE